MVSYNMNTSQLLSFKIALGVGYAARAARKTMEFAFAPIVSSEFSQGGKATETPNLLHHEGNE